MKKTCIIALAALLLFIGGCRPEGIIPPDDMVTIMSEFYQADSFIESNPDQAGVYDNYRIYAPIVEKYGYTKKIFHESIVWYLHNPAAFEKIFKKTEARLRQLDADAGKQIERDEEEMDEGGHDEIQEGSEPRNERLDDSVPGDTVKDVTDDGDRPDKLKKVDKEEKVKKTQKRTRKLTKKELRKIQKELEEK